MIVRLGRVMINSTRYGGYVCLDGYRSVAAWRMDRPRFSEREKITKDPHVRIPVGRYGFRLWFGSE